MSSSARTVLVNATSPGLSAPMRSSAVLPAAMVCFTVALMALVVVSNSGRLTTALNLAARAWNSFMKSDFATGDDGTWQHVWQAVNKHADNKLAAKSNR